MLMRVSKKKLVLGVCFAVSYALLFFFGMISSTLKNFFSGIPVINVFTDLFLPVLEWNLNKFPIQADYMLLLLPIAGFFFIYYLIDWANDFFKTSFASTGWFVLLFFVLSLIAFYINLSVYFGNISFLNNQEIPFDFFAIFRQSHFFYFVLAGVLGWASHKIVRQIPETTD
jgi:hypothetical protein